MKIFIYKAVTKKGVRKKNTIVAFSRANAEEKLLSRGLYLIDLLEIKVPKQRKIKMSSLIIFTQSLFSLLKVGLPILDALEILEEKHRNTKLHLIFSILCEDLKKGNALSVGLSRLPNIFDELYISIIKAGEKTGSIIESFKRLDELIVKEDSINKKISSALIYPVFLISFSLIVLVALIFFLIPSMGELFEDRDLHAITRVVIDTSTFLNKHAVFLLSLFVILFFGVFCLLKSKKIKLFLTNQFLYIPVFKNIYTKIKLSRFFRTLSLLLRSGVSIVDSLEISKGVLKNCTLENIMKHSKKRIIEGQKFSSTMKTFPQIPSLVNRMLAIGEESGKLAEVMENISLLYTEDVEKSLNQFVVLLQPCILIFLGIVVTCILLAVLIPLTDVSSILN